MAARLPDSDDIAKLNHFPDDLNHRDLRSRTHATNRHRKQSQKYYGYRAVHPSWINQPYYHLDLSPHHTSTARFTCINPVSMTAPAMTEIALSEVNSNKLPTSRSSPTLASLAKSLSIAPGQTLKVSTSKWTPRDTYEHKQNGIWPLDVRHHRGKRIREKKAQKWFLEDMRRREKQRAARMRVALGDEENVDEVGLRRDCDEGLGQGERVDNGMPAMGSRDWQENGVAVVEVNAVSRRAESVLSLQDFEVVTDPGSEVGDNEEWEILSAWSC